MLQRTPITGTRCYMKAPEIALALVGPRQLAALERSESLKPADIATILGDLELLDRLPEDGCVTHLYFGSEFCEHLLPKPDELARAIAAAQRFRLTLVLATPAANDTLVERILELERSLPPKAEILVNDWGVAHQLHAEAPTRPLIAGRQMAKMIKDPRVPSSAWMKPYPSSYAQPGFGRLLKGFGMIHIELDVPPFAPPDLYVVPGFAVSVRVPYAYVAKGRLCKIGSLRQPRPEKFAPGRACHRECLGIVEKERQGSAIVSYARGNSLYYRHDATMTHAVRAATTAGSITRLVFSGI